MKQSDIVPKVFYDTNIDYVYPVGVSPLLVALCALITGMLIWKQHKDNSGTFDDIILALKTGNHEALERVGRVHCRQQRQMDDQQQERVEDAPYQEDVHQVSEAGRHVGDPDRRDGNEMDDTRQRRPGANDKTTEGELHNNEKGEAETSRDQPTK